MKIIKVSTELEMSVHEFPSGTIREHNKALCELIGNGCDLVEHVMPKELHKEMNMNVGPTRLVQPDFYLLVDVDDLQKQVNTLENEVHRMKRVEARRKWRYGRKNH